MLASKQEHKTTLYFISFSQGGMAKRSSSMSITSFICKVKCGSVSAKIIRTTILDDVARNLGKRPIVVVESKHVIRFQAPSQP